MSADKADKAKETGAARAGAGPGRALMDAEEWKDGPGEKTICEYHKDGLPDGVCEKKEVDDLDAFTDYWKGREGGKLRSEYHKEGAPYIEEPSEWDGHSPRTGRPAARAPPAGAPAPAKARTGDRPPAKEEPARADGPPEDGTTARPAGRKGLPPLERLIDVPSIELATYAMFRSVIGRGIRIPIKREGVVDMDLIVKDKDVILNTNEMMLDLPRLAIWRFVFAYKGEPIMEYGRGVKNDLKVHRWRLFKLLLQIWWRGRKKAKQVD
jgi:hypothetical protein